MVSRQVIVLITVMLLMMLYATTDHIMLANKRKSEDIDDETLSFMLGTLGVVDGRSILEHMVTRFGNSPNRIRQFTDIGVDSQGLWQYMSIEDELPQERMYFEMSNAHREALLTLFDQEEVSNWRNLEETDSDEYDSYHDVFEIRNHEGRNVRVEARMFLEIPAGAGPKLEINFFQSDDAKCSRT